MLLDQRYTFFIARSCFLLKPYTRLAAFTSPWMKLVLALAVLVGAGLAACGGGGGSSNSPASSSTSQTVTPSSTIPGGGVTDTGGILLATPTPVQVAANQNTVSVDIQVPAVASAINAIALAVTAVNTGSTYVSASGATVRQGNQYWLWIVGTGITPSLTVGFSGPGDIATSGAPLALQNSAGTIYPITCRLTRRWARAPLFLRIPTAT